MNAAEKKGNPCVILAGAGTGKTYTIVEKVKHLILSKTYKPHRIVCITFSNEAANSLKLKVIKAVGLQNEPIVRTFHAFSGDLIRKYGHLAGMKENFNVLTPEDAMIFLHNNFKINANYCHKYVHSIGMAKDLGITIDSMKKCLQDELKKNEGVNLERKLENLQFELQTLYLHEDRDKKKSLLLEIKRISSIIELRKFTNAWTAYEKLKEKSNYLDYSDLNKDALELLKRFPVITEDFDCIIVDEFQDTNKIQLDFLVALAPHGNITIVGDLNQSIYRFRGAYRENFAAFKKHFLVSQKDIINLDKSHRSPNRVLRAAHRLILNNYENKEDCFQVENAYGIGGDKVDVYELKNAKEEARKVVELVEKELGNGRQANDICIMFRTHQQGRLIRRILDFKEIPYSSSSRGHLLKNKSIKTVIDYLSILDKLKRKAKGGEQAWWDLTYNMNLPDKDLIEIGKFIKDNREADNISALMLSMLDKLPLSDAGKLSTKILTERIKLLIPSLPKETPSLINDVCKISGLLNREKTKEEKEIMLNLRKFYDISKEHSALYSSDLTSFISYLDAIESLGIEIPESFLEDYGVRLMTSHATKGLEYKVVIIMGLAQKKFPIEKVSSNSLIPAILMPELANLNFSEEQIEEFIHQHEMENNLLEERRLCYVSFTRAREKLILTYAKEYANKKVNPSQFLNEIDYKHNSDIDFFVDSDEKYTEPETKLKTALSLGTALMLDEKNLTETLGQMRNNICSEFSLENKEFSPSALLLFDGCQKEYEYKYVYNMPERQAISWEAMRLGSFVHCVLEIGVKNDIKNIDGFMELAKRMHLTETWNMVDFAEAEHLIKVFFERNKDKYNKLSKTEQSLKTEIEGIKFTGFADRIDFSPDGISIIDYKTGKSYVDVRHRNWQLGYYALAASQFGKVRRMTLDMLKQEKPLDFELDDKGNATSVDTGRMQFNIYEVRDELVETARKIICAYKTGFKPCPIEKNCEFCKEFVYGL